jgi:hypothetical protein
MPSENKKLPGVLMLLLSALGILFSLLIVAGAVFTLQIKQPLTILAIEEMSLALTGALALLVGLLQIPALVFAIRSLRGKVSLVQHPSLIKAASIAGLVWLGIIVTGILAVRTQVAWFFFVPLTLLAVAVPVWWLVEFSRRGLPRPSPFREWGTLAIGLTAAPLLIMVIEISMLLVIALAVLAVFISQPDLLGQLQSIAQDLNLNQGGAEQLEQLIVQLSRNPVIASALFLMIGILAPIVEELFKPMALWFLLNRPLKESEGYSLGLISGGAFALLESGGLVSQITPETWVQAIVLRAATGLLHIGLSGFVGYQLVSNCNQKRFGHAILYLFGAAGLHGAWNSLALLSSFAAAGAPAVSAAEFQPSLGSILSVTGMIMVFGFVLFLTLHLNHTLQNPKPGTPDYPSSLSSSASIE